MADETLTDLTEFTGLIAPDDWLYLVDKSDTTENAAGSSFKVKVGALVNRVLLAVITNTTEGEFDFTSIPSGFNNLVIVGQIRGEVAATEATLRVFLNTDTTDANYHVQQISNNNAVINVNEASTAFAGVVPAASSPTDSYGEVEFIIPHYTLSRLKVIKCSFDSYLDTDKIRNGRAMIVSAITAAITRVRIRDVNDPTSQLFGTLRLYGEM
jgi:hypothetical protein